MARTSRAERHRRRESALALVSQGKGFSDVVTAQMSQWGCSRSSAQRDCRWAHDQLQLSIDSKAYYSAGSKVCQKYAYKDGGVFAYREAKKSDESNESN